MKLINLPKLPKKIWLSTLLVVTAVLLVGGVVLAGQIITHQGTVTVVAPTPTYIFAVYDAPTSGNEIIDGNSAFWNLGTVDVAGTTSRTVYIAKTGTGDVTVTPAVVGLDAATGAIVFSPLSVTVTDSTRQSITATFTAVSVTTSPDDFDITFTGNP